MLCFGTGSLFLYLSILFLVTHANYHNFTLVTDPAHIIFKIFCSRPIYGQLVDLFRVLSILPFLLYVYVFLLAFYVYNLTEAVYYFPSSTDVAYLLIEGLIHSFINAFHA